MGRGREAEEPLQVMARETEKEALLLLLDDRRLYEPIVVREALAGDEDERRQLALTLARLADPRGLDALLELLEDPSPAVRRAAAFGLGRLGEVGGREPLLRAAADPDREVGRQAVAAAAALGAPLAAVTDALAGASTGELWPRLLPSLDRFPADERIEVERLGLAEAPPEWRLWAAYALTQARRPEQRDVLRALLGDDRAEVRAWSAAALGEVGGRGDLGSLLPLLEDAEGAVVEAALAAGWALVDRGIAAPSLPWRARLVQLVDDPRRAVRAAALEACAAWLLDDELGAILVARARNEDPKRQRERERAILALAEGGDPRAEELLAAAAKATDPGVRATAARGAGLLGNAALLRRLGDDADARVRRTVLSQELHLLARSGADVADLRGRVEQGLESSRPELQLAAVEFLASVPVLPAKELGTLGGEDGGANVRVRLAVIRALEERAKRVPADETAAETQLRRLAQDRIFVVRRTAAQALEERGLEAPPVGSVQTGRSVGIYQEVLVQASRPASVRVETEIGAFTVELSCREAPLACTSFRQLAAQGFYDGLPFFRVDPGRLARAGCDPGGGPGYTVRDEPSPHSFEKAGWVGMVSEVPDAMSSEFFITLSAQPQLDGVATYLGRVVDGLDVLAGLVEGDRIVAMTEILP